MDIEKLANDLEKEFPWIPTGLKMVVAKYVQGLIIEARIDEINCNMTVDSERLNKKRIAELEAQKSNMS